MTDIVRKPLLHALLGERSVSSVDVREIRFAAGQKTGRHLHRCPVIGYIAAGAAVMEIEGQPPQDLPTGAAFQSPPTPSSPASTTRPRPSP